MQKTLMMKLIAVILVLMLSLSNFLVLVSYAAEISNTSDIDIFSQDSETKNKNVEFNSYLVKDNNQTYSAVLDIAEANKIYINVKIANGGYLKAGTINFEEESFNIKAQDEAVSTIQNIDYEKKEITLNQINAGTEIELQIPIEMSKNEIYNIQNLNKNNKVIFTGTYVTEKGKEVDIEKEIILNIAWDTSVEISLEQNINKYIDVLDNETLIELKLNTNLIQNAMPVKETNIELDVPEIEGKLPKYVNVVAEKLLSTVGTTNGLDFGENNFEYIEEEKKIKVNIQNIANETGEASWKQGSDEYKVILVYEKLAEEEKTVTINSKASFDVYGKAERVEKTANTDFILKGNIGNINEMELHSDNSNIYKSFMYANSEYETEYKLNWSLNIGYAGINDKIMLSDASENFVNSDSLKTVVNNNTYYKQTIISKKNFEKILGNEGYIKILNEANEELVSITLNSTEDENIVINYQNTDLSKIKLELSKPQTEGKLEIKHVKAIKSQTDFGKDLIKTFTVLENEVNLNSVYNKVLEAENVQEQTIEQIELINVNSMNSINLLEPEAKIEMSINRGSLVTGSINEDIELYVALINNKEEYSLFNNPVIDIRLPEDVEYIQIKDVKLVFEEELNIQNTELFEDESGIKHIRILLNGVQTIYNIGNIITGANLIITGDIALKDIEETKQAEIEAVCANEGTESSSKTAINLVKVVVQEEVIEPEVVEPEQTQQPETEEETNQEEQPEEEIKENVEEPVQENQEQGNVEQPETEEQEQEDEIVEENNTNNLDVVIESSIPEDEIVRWGDIISYKITLTNNSNNTYNNILLYSDIPENAVYIEAYYNEETDEDNFEEDYEKRKVEWNIDELNPGETIEKYYNVKLYNGHSSEETVEARRATILTNAVASINGKILGYNYVENILEEGYINIDSYEESISSIITKGDIVTSYIYMYSNKDLQNVKASLNIPKGITCEQAYFSYFDENATEYIYKEGININENNIDFNIDKLANNETKYITIKFKIESPEQLEKTNISEQLIINYNNVIQKFNILKFKVDIPELKVRQIESVLDGSINENEIIKYIISVDNVGTSMAKGVTITDYLPENVQYIKTETISNGETKEYLDYSNGITEINTNIDIGDTFKTIITAKVLGTTSKNMNNVVKVTASGIDEIESNSSIEVISSKNNNNNQNNNENNNQDNQNDEENAKHKISGQVWFDKNSNGIKDEEQTISSVKVILINNNNQIQKQVDVNKNGKYRFDDLEKGEYRVIFIYDTNTYGVTKYRATSANIDSDAIETKIQLDGKEQTAGITEIIELGTSDIQNIDMGLIENPKFDLKLEKTISSITVKTAKEEKTYKYDNKKLAKVEFHAKEIDKSEVAITYKIKVTNEGQIDGYATKIVDYLPEELKFNQDLNKNWYLGEDGNLYTNILENQKILPGETKEVELVLDKKMSGEETGLINNKAEIVDSYNNYGLKDIDSINGNNKANEDDTDYADVYLGIKTGKVILYTSLAISQAIVLVVGIYLIKKKVLDY